VIIDLPQAVNAAANNGALGMLERDVSNLRSTPGRYAPEIIETEFAREMWMLFEQGKLHAEIELTGVVGSNETPSDPSSVMLVIDDARQKALRHK
jgi:RIO kinase 1